MADCTSEDASLIVSNNVSVASAERSEMSSNGSGDMDSDSVTQVQISHETNNTNAVDQPTADSPSKVTIVANNAENTEGKEGLELGEQNLIDNSNNDSAGKKINVDVGNENIDNTETQVENMEMMEQVDAAINLESAPEPMDTDEIGEKSLLDDNTECTTSTDFESSSTADNNTELTVTGDNYARIAANKDIESSVSEYIEPSTTVFESSVVDTNTELTTDDKNIVLGTADANTGEMVIDKDVDLTTTSKFIHADTSTTSTSVDTDTKSTTVDISTITSVNTNPESAIITTNTELTTNDTTINTESTILVPNSELTAVDKNVESTTFNMESATSENNIESSVTQDNIGSQIAIRNDQEITHPHESQEIVSVTNTNETAMEVAKDDIINPDVNIKVEMPDSIDESVDAVHNAPFIKSEIPDDIEMAQVETNVTLTNGTSSDDMETGEQEERTVTMLDVLQQQQDLEDDANAVLGASDENNCTYNEGYVRRQAVYACLTCCSEAKTDPKKRAGVCLACALSCHENHELVELYTKRNFRCDCGNPKFNKNPCNFTADKSEFNVNNSYNQNFSGLYCICHRPYPDPESSIDDEMIQCIICEDWLHASHLDAVVPESDQYSEMICKSCMEKKEFLNDYSEFAVNVDDSLEVHIVSNEEKVKRLSRGTDKHLKENGSSEQENTNDVCNKTGETKSNKSVDESEQSNTAEHENTNVISDKIGECKNITSAVSEQCEKVTNCVNSVILSFENLENTSELSDVNDTVSCTVENKIVSGNDLLLKNKTNEHEENIESELGTKNNESDASHNTFEISLQNKDNETNIENQESTSKQDVTNEGGDVNRDMNILCSQNEKSTDPDKTENNDSDESSTLKITQETNLNDKISNEVEKQSDIEGKQINIPKEILVEPSSVQGINSNNKLGIENEKQSDLEKEPIEFSQEKKIEGTDKIEQNILLETPTLNSEVQPASDNANDKLFEQNLGDKVQELKESRESEQMEIQENELLEKPIEEKSSNNPNNNIPETCAGIVKEIKDANESILDIQEENHTVEVNENHSNNAATTYNENSKPFEQTDFVKDTTADVEMKEDNATMFTIAAVTSTQINGDSITIDNINKRKLSPENEDSPDCTVSKKTKRDENKNCKRTRSTRKFKGATFWPCNWRYKLCSCNDCVEMYKSKDVLFLLDNDDTVTAYEDLGKTKTGGKVSQYEMGLKAFSSLDRIRQINAITEYNRMRERLLAHLEKFKNTNQVIKVEDIESFFANIKPKNRPDGVYFCR